MRNFLIGLALLLTGLVLILLTRDDIAVANLPGQLQGLEFSIDPVTGELVQPVDQAGEEIDLFADPFAGSVFLIGLLLSVLGPLSFWLVLPVISGLRRHEPPRGT